MDDENLAKMLGKAARKARTELGMSQAEVAEAAGISVEFLGRIERGKTLPSVPTLCRLADVLRVRSDVLLGRERVEASPPRPALEREERLVLKRWRAASATTQRLVREVLGALVQAERRTSQRR